MGKTPVNVEKECLPIPMVVQDWCRRPYLRGTLPQFTGTARQRFFAPNDIADKREQMTKALRATMMNRML
jgi:hypothetical protein